MAAVLTVSPEERQAFAYLLRYEIEHLSRGTREHRESADGLREVYEELLASPEDQPVELTFANHELYAVGIRAFADASELEEYWLDNKASMQQSGDPAPYQDAVIATALPAHYPEVAEHPETWSFDHVRPVFLELSSRIDRALTAASPSVRGLYNKERAEIIRRTTRVQEERAEARGRTYAADTGIESWRRAVRVSHLGSGQMTDIDLGARRILVANVDGEFFAIDAICSHVPRLSNLTNLAGGRLDTNRMCVECPWHGSEFSIRSGRVVTQPYPGEFKKEHLIAGRVMALVDPKKSATDLRAYRTKVEDGYVWVNIV